VADTSPVSPSSSASLDRPAERSSGLSASRERAWGLAGGVVGALAGIGSLLVSWLVPGVTLGQLAGAPFPLFFARREMIALDYYFLTLLLVGTAFLTGAVVVLRAGRYPRSDGFGLVLLGAILSSLGGVILFGRVWAMAHG
jgi:hypothetical protein